MSTVIDGAPAPVVHVVEDDASLRRSMARVLAAAGYDTRSYASAAEFLAAIPSGRGCVTLDLQLPGPSGLEIQERLIQADCTLPVIFVTGHGDIPKSVRAIKAGAVDFLTKPIDAPALLDAVARALAANAEAEATRRVRDAARAGFARLTPREREVFAHVISGQLNKQVAFDLGTTEHTIKVHRQRVMEKMGADSLPHLVRLAAVLGLTPVGHVGG